MEGRAEPQRPVRAAGGGRKKLAETDPALAAQPQALVDRQIRGGFDVAAGMDDEGEVGGYGWARGPRRRFPPIGWSVWEMS